MSTPEHPVPNGLIIRRFLRFHPEVQMRPVTNGVEVRDDTLQYEKHYMDYGLDESAGIFSQSIEQFNQTVKMSFRNKFRKHAQFANFSQQLLNDDVMRKPYKQNYQRYCEKRKLISQLPTAGNNIRLVIDSKLQMVQQPIKLTPKNSLLKTDYQVSGNQSNFLITQPNYQRLNHCYLDNIISIRFKMAQRASDSLIREFIHQKLSRRFKPVEGGLKIIDPTLNISENYRTYIMDETNNIFTKDFYQFKSSVQMQAKQMRSMLNDSVAPREDFYKQIRDFDTQKSKKLFRGRTARSNYVQHNGWAGVQLSFDDNQNKAIFQAPLTSCRSARIHATSLMKIASLNFGQAE